MREYCLIVLGSGEAVKKLCERRGFDLTRVKVLESLYSTNFITSRVVIKEESQIDARVGQTRRRIQQWHAQGSGLVHWFLME